MCVSSLMTLLSLCSLRSAEASAECAPRGAWAPRPQPAGALQNGYRNEATCVLRCTLYIAMESLYITVDTLH